MTANMNHMNGAATQTNDSDVARAQATLVEKATAGLKGAKADPQDLWSALVQRAAISHALEDLLEIPDNSRERLHGAVRRVLNTISHEYNIVVHGPDVCDSTPAVTFASLRDHTVPGSYHAVNTNPNWQAFMGTHRHLKEALKCPLELIDAPRHQAELCGFGNAGYKADEMDIIEQFEQHLASVKSSRPDLATVHGFQRGGGQLRLTSLNACGLAAFEASERHNLQAWVALAVMLYHSSDTRDRRLTYIPGPCQDSGRWDIRRDPHSHVADFAVFSNEASSALRRMTWTAFVPGGQIPESPLRDDDFERRTREVPAVGVLKVSWPRPSSPAKSAVTATESSEAAADLAAGITIEPDAGPVPPCESTTGQTELPLTEGELLRHAHRDGWLPGLVRYHDFPQSDATIETTIDGETHERFKDMFHLASAGKPFREWTSLHLLEVAYDLAETHLQMLERDVFHRDLSWFNVMCGRQQHPAMNAKQALAGIPCVKNIFGDDNGEPTVILIDLDHAARTDRIWKPGYKTGIGRTGTPMFIALELAGQGEMHRVNYTQALSKASVQELTHALEEVESRADLFQRAFPDGSGKPFKDNFAKVVALEKVRRKAYPPADLRSNPHEPHCAHHDVETVYWTMLWSFSRALPKGFAAYDELETPLKAFCEAMLTHRIGQETHRLAFLKDEDGCRAFLHERLRHFAKFFRALALYFSIPWHVYVRDGTVKIDHAHHAIRRLLLRELIFLQTDDGQKVNLALDTTQPRIFVSRNWGVDCRMNLVDDYGWGMVCEDGAQRKRKRGQGDPNPQAGEPHAKKAKVGDAQANESDDATAGQVTVDDTKIDPCSARGRTDLEDLDCSLDDLGTGVIISSATNKSAAWVF